MMRRLENRGDTIVEVLLAMTLLSAILFTSWAIVNRSSQINLTARQRVVMVNQLKEQAEIIESLYSNPDTKASVVDRTFGAATAKSFAQSSNIAAVPCDNTRSASGVTNAQNPLYGFHFDENANVSTSNVPKTVSGYENAKVWIQMVNATDSSYIDFYIRGCWLAVGGGQREDNSHFVMRLNTQ